MRPIRGNEAKIVIARLGRWPDGLSLTNCPGPGDLLFASRLANQLRCHVETVAFAALSGMEWASGRYDWSKCRSPLHIQDDVYRPFVACRWWILQYCDVGRLERKHGTDMLAQPIRPQVWQVLVAHVGWMG